MTERTLSIVKPNAVKNGNTGDILARFEKEGLKIVASRMTWLSTVQAQGFYAVHRERPFFGSLVEFMTSGPVVVSVLEGENAVQRHRDILGATNPAEAADGTIRKLYGESLEANGTHGSDGPETAAFEIGHFFPGTDIFTYDRK